jgi:hypothetical protein
MSSQQNLDDIENKQKKIIESNQSINKQLIATLNDLFRKEGFNTDELKASEANDKEKAQTLVDSGLKPLDWNLIKHPNYLTADNNNKSKNFFIDYNKTHANKITLRPERRINKSKMNNFRYKRTHDGQPIQNRTGSMSLDSFNTNSFQGTSKYMNNQQPTNHTNANSVSNNTARQLNTKFSHNLQNNKIKQTLDMATSTKLTRKSVSTLQEMSTIGKYSTKLPN